MNKITHKLQKGFTLIELLIVIAVLGVLATVVLVAINPLEQISRGEDSGRKTSVSQLGHAMQAFITIQQLQVPPAPGANWQTGILVNAQEITQALTAPANSRGACTTNAVTGYCYLVSGTNFLIWTIIESRSETVKGGGACATAPTTNYAAAVYDSSQGKEGVGCLGTPITNNPAVGITLN